jgi:elongator complex protein 2
LSCGKDRLWAIFARSKENKFEFKLTTKLANAHTRIIWGISWAHDDSMFATASREKQSSVKFWTGKDSSEMGK